MAAETPPAGASPRLSFAREVLEIEARAIASVAPLLGESFEGAVELLLGCKGRVVITGIGKAGLIGNKLSATLASTGTPSYALHPTDAIHGDLGRVRPEDVVILMSNSGESREVIQLIDPLKRIGTTLIGATGNGDSTLARNVDLVLDCGRTPEACPLGLAPTASTAALLALGDALAMTVLKERGWETADYARYHPGGALGRSLMRVEEIMRRDEQVTLVAPESTGREVLIAMNRTPGRPGAAIVVDHGGSLAGIFTDGDLARRLEEGTGFLERPISDVMIREPLTIAPDRLASEAFSLLRERHVDQLPVVDADRRPVGLVDVQDLLDARIV